MLVALQCCWHIIGERPRHTISCVLRYPLSASSHIRASLAYTKRYYDDHARKGY